MQRKNNLEAEDPAIFDLMAKELHRQQNGLELIASENFVSEAVIEALGSPLTNKYAEGYPGRRYYGGCVYHDEIERIAIQRAKDIFGADHANVQPHAGAVANLAAYFALIKPGDKILAMNLEHGGHLTHGSVVNFSGKLYEIIPYGVDAETGRINYDEVDRLAQEHRPALIVAGASAYARVLDFERFAAIASSIQCPLMVDMAHIAGLVAADLHPSPIPHADVVTTTTHKTLRGPRGGLILCKDKWKKKINSAVFPGSQGGPLMHVIAAKAVAFKEALDPCFKTYQQQVLDNAKALASTLSDEGYNLVSGGTDNHLVLVDLRGSGVSGKEAEESLAEVEIIVNKNKVPFDTATAQNPSGMRLGTPALTSRGMKTDDMIQIGKLIADTLKKSREKSDIRHEVEALVSRFPIYAG